MVLSSRPSGGTRQDLTGGVSHGRNRQEQTASRSPAGAAEQADMGCRSGLSREGCRLAEKAEVRCVCGGVGWEDPYHYMNSRL